MKDKLSEVLRKNGTLGNDLHVLSMTEIQGGYSKKTWSFDVDVKINGVQKSLPLILRLNNPNEYAILPNDRKTEHNLLNSLATHTSIPVPRSYMVLEPEDFGVQGQVIERIDGITKPTSFFGANENQALNESIGINLVEKLAELHTTDRKKIDPSGQLDDPENAGIEVGSHERYLETTTDYFLKSYPKMAFDTLPSFYQCFKHLARQRIRPLPLCVTHGELNPSNLIYKDGKINGIIDWELAHIGDPREDLGWFAHMEMATGTSFIPSVKKHGGFLAYYNKLTGFNVSEEEVNFFRFIGMARVLVNVQIAIANRMLEKNKDVTNLYLFQFVVGVSMVHNLLLGYDKDAEYFENRFVSPPKKAVA